MKTACGAEERLVFWDGVLQLDEFEVVHQAEDVAEKSLQFTVVPKLGAAVCPHCGGLCAQTQQTRDRDGIRDLPLGERAVVLRVRVREFRCDACDRCFTPPGGRSPPGRMPPSGFWSGRRPSCGTVSFSAVTSPLRRVCVVSRRRRSNAGTTTTSNGSSVNRPRN